VTIAQILARRGCPRTIVEFFSEPKNSRAWPHRLETAGYVAVNNPDRRDGKWHVAGRRQMIYVRRELDRAAAERAAHDLIGNENERALQPASEEDFAP
jgi:hypothetical protein